MALTHLGSWEDAINALRDAHLIDTSILSREAAESRILSDCTEICDGDKGPCYEADHGVPPYGDEARDYFSYAEMEGTDKPGWTNRTAELCADLGLDDKYCYPFSNDSLRK